MDREPDARPDEAPLVARLRAGEEAAFAELVALHGGRLLGAARRILGNEEDARDVVQETMLAAFRSVGGFEGASAIGTWLHRILVNASLMKLRARRRRPEEPADPFLPQFTDHGHFRGGVRAWAEPPEAPLEREEARAAVRACLERLPEPHRTALVLRDLEGLATEEVATALGVTPGAAKVRVHRARQALRTLLEPHFRRDA